MDRRPAGGGGPVSRCRAAARACALGASWLAAACGGGGDGGRMTGPGAGLVPVPAIPRIEPYERSAVVPASQERAMALPPQAQELSAPGGPVPLVTLGPLGPLGPLEAGPGPAASAAPAGQSSPRGAAQAIGVARDLDMTRDPQDLARLWSWTTTADGGVRASLSLRSEGALGVRVGLRVGRLPPQAQVTVAGVGGRPERVDGARILAALARLPAGARTALAPPEAAAAGAALRAGRHDDEASRLYWLPAVAGPQVLLQLELPPGTDPRSVEVAVPRLAHLWWTHAAAREGIRPKIGESGSCQADASCSPEYDAQARAVARLEFMRGDTAYLCTGTLMADVAASGVPYFLTAQHCVGDPVTASSVSTFWFYRASACNSQVPDRAAVAVHGGAEVLSASTVHDTTLLRLVGSPPAHAVHAGSLLAPVESGATLASLHHPGGDLLKVSVGTLEGVARCDGTRCQPVAGDADFLSVRWRLGTTESGSSGAPLFATLGSQRYVTGHLFAGSASCQQPGASDFFGRLDKAYPALRPWLGAVPGAPG